METASWKRYVLPLLLLVAVVGGLAWLTQFLPNWRTTGGGGLPMGDGGVSVCRFPAPVVLWSLEKGEEKLYVKEFEKGEHGHYDFLFENPSDKEAEMGLVDANCACSAVLLGFPREAAWQSLADKRVTDPAVQLDDSGVSWSRIVREIDIDKPTSGKEPRALSVALPPGCKGVVRLTFDARGGHGERVALILKLWVQPKGEPKLRQTRDLLVGIAIVAPLQFVPSRVNLGPLAPGDKGYAEFHVWSATRSSPDVTFSDDKPLFEVEKKPLDEEARLKLQAKLRDEEKIFTRVKAAWVLSVTVHEENGGRQHDLGPFIRALPILLDRLPLDYETPLVTGVVRSDLEIGAPKDGGRIDLGVFNPSDDVSKKTTLWTDAKVVLNLKRYDPISLDVSLKHLAKESSDKKSKWLLEVKVPANSLIGAFPEKSAVFLEIQGSPPRLVRIPVVGTATAKP